MIDFKIDDSKCIKCGSCVKDCPVSIITMKEGEIPKIAPENEKACMGCQHCLAICPTGALSIMGVNPDDCVSTSAQATPESVDALIRSRRTVRQFKKENVSSEKLQKLYKAAANAPTGKNTRTVNLIVIDDIAEMNKLREKAISMIEDKSSKGTLGEQWSFFASVAKAYRNGNDIIFRGAPHLIIATLPEDGPCPDADGMIALSYIELMAASLGLGTVWLGFFMYLMQAVPEVKDLLNVPEGHKIAYPLLVGEPSVKYHRGVIRDEIPVNKLSFGD
ncbi:MAG: nitroreductase [Denitrovibrio sp.]|nr:MAG: nitroreductase [Denitrovibrio sp.]